MRLVCLSAVAFLTFVAGNPPRVSEFDASNQHQVHVTSTSFESTARLLRTRRTIDEERAGGGISVSGVDKIAKFLKPSKVTDEQLQKWLHKGKSAEKVFYRMGLTNAHIENLFESPQFVKWLQYADDLSVSGKRTSAISVLLTQYGDDTLYRWIELAKKGSKTKALGTRLQTDQVDHWITTRKDPDEVFKLYDLKNAGKNILSEPRFAVWAKYVDDLNANKEEAAAAVSIIPTLRKHYSDEDLFKIVLTAKAETMGTKLEDAFVQFWIQGKETPENVLVKLGLGKTTKTLLQNPLLNILTKYTEAYSVQYKKTTTVIETLTRTFDDVTVVNMLHAGKANTRTKQIATKLETEQLKMWRDSGKSVDDVYKLLNLSRVWGLFESPLFIRWLQYADDLNASGKGPSAISVLSTQYSDDTVYRWIELAKQEPKIKALGTKLQTDQMDHWIATRKDPNEVFKLYGLNHAGKNILSEPQFTAWTKYINDLDAKKKGTAAVSIIPTLRKYYSDEDLFKIVLTAKGLDKTEAMGTQLEDAFMQFWIHRKTPPENVLAELGLREKTKTLLENPLLNMLTKYTEVYSIQYKKTTTVIETLTRTLGDDKVAKILLAGKAEATTKRIATKFETEQLEMWWNSGKSVDDVYELLNLPRFRDLLADFNGKPVFNTWLEYMNTFSTKNPEKTSSLFSTLATSFNDRAMMQILQAAKKYPSMESSAAKLQLKKAESIFSSGVSPSEAFLSVALDNVGDSILRSSLISLVPRDGMGLGQSAFEFAG